MEPPTHIWLTAIREAVASYRGMIDAAVEQRSDAELRQRPAESMNSVAVLLRHLGGNLRSRWTDFLTTDGEKPDRDRDAEFTDWQGDRASLLAYFDEGWSYLTSAIEQVTEANLTTRITIRGEEHSIPQALMRSITHLAYHVGQIVMIALMVHAGEWKWLTIAPGQSKLKAAGSSDEDAAKGTFTGRMAVKYNYTKVGFGPFAPPNGPPPYTSVRAYFRQ